MKICVRCRTENDEDFKYCKLCGAELPCVDPKTYHDNCFDEEESGRFQNGEDISSYEMNVFVGKNNYVIVPKFIRLQREEKKLSFCLPILLLGLFFGFFGVAAWFLYRKMTKPAFFLIAASLLLTVGDMAVNFNQSYQYINSLADALSLVVRKPEISEEALNTIVNDISTRYATETVGIFSRIEDILGNVVSPIVLSLFGDWIYMEHSIKRISEQKQAGLSDTEYLLSLHRAGGTSGGRVAIGFVIYFLAVMIIASVPIVVAVAGF